MSERTKKILIAVAILLWLGIHCAGLTYGTKDLPLHQSYIGDEQSPVNGALHILNERSVLGLRNLPTLYYGPIFATLAVPAVLYDAGVKYIKGTARSAESYKESLLYDWGAIAFAGRAIALIFALVGLYAAYIFLKPSGTEKISTVALLGVTLLAFNYHFFEYSHFFKHWIFIVVALLIQWVSLRKIVESGKKRWWVLHTTAALFAAGISYFSLLSMVMWVPYVYEWVRNKNWNTLRAFMRMVYSTTIGVLLLVWWHPLVVVRLLGFAGVVDSSLGNLGDTQSPFNLMGTSFGYYSSLLSTSLVPLFIALLLVASKGVKKYFLTDSLVWAIVLPGIANFLLFAPAQHHEGRYMLPTIVSFVVVVGYVLVKYFSEPDINKMRRAFIVGLIAFQLVFHIVHIGVWINAYAAGPAEKTMLTEVLKKAEEGKPKVLLVQSYIAGHPHTKEAYARYAKDFGKEGFNLYKEILSSPSPRNVQLLDATYMTRVQFEAKPEVAAQFDQVIVKVEPRVGEINQFDFIDENMTRVWWYDELLPSYIYLK